jgi:hypothetical protein
MKDKNRNRPRLMAVSVSPRTYSVLNRMAKRYKTSVRAVADALVKKSPKTKLKVEAYKKAVNE